MNGTAAMKSAALGTLVALATTAMAQPQVEWSKTYGGNGADRGHSIRQTPDGGFIVSGYTDTGNNGDVSGVTGANDVWVVKLDAQGNLQWQDAFGGPDSEPFTEANTRVHVTADGGYLVTAESNSSSGDLSSNNGLFDLWVFKLNAGGALQWQRSIGGALYDAAHAITELADGSFLLAGFTSSNDGDVTGNQGMTDAWVVKITADGDFEWQKTFGGTWTDAFTAFKATDDGGFIAAGYTLSNDGDLAGLNPDGFGGYADFWVVKLNSEVEIEWQTVVGGTDKDEAKALFQAPDGGYIVAGESESNDGDLTVNNGDRDWWVVKLNGSGTLEWSTSLGGSARDEVRTAGDFGDGSGFFVLGTTESSNNGITTNHGGKDVWLAKLDYDGNIVYNQCYGGSDNEVGFDATVASSGALVVTGRSNSDLNGDITTETQGEDLWVFTLGGTVGLTDAPLSDAPSVYPNPFSDVLRFGTVLERIELYGLDGRLLLTARLTDRIAPEGLTSGVYIVKSYTAGSSRAHTTAVYKR